MIILGDISGIQNYVFDVAEEGGGQAQRLRARSFFVQLLAETAALRVLRALKWPLDFVRLSGAGKFLLQGPNVPDVEKYLAREKQIIDEWLLSETRAELRLALAWADSGSEVASYLDAQRQLQRTKAQAWAPMADDGWNTSRFLLEPLDTPCSLCGHARAQQEEKDRDTGGIRRVCHICASFRRLGQRLPRATWLVVHDTIHPADFRLFGLGVTVIGEGQASDQPGEIVAVANLREAEERPAWCPRERFMERRLMAHIPTDQHGSPVWFTELAPRAQGDQLLAVLKADADSLGVRFGDLLDSGGLKVMEDLSKQLDRFFAGRLRQELANNHNGRWQSIYTIFAGGDDLVMVGPWNIMVDFAGQMREWFM
jgi:CRISPR-associated protein Csm1